MRHVASAKNCTTKEAEEKYLMTKEQFKEKMKKIEASEGGCEAFFDKEIT